MSTQLKPHYTPQEYLAIERRAEHKSEYFAGEMFAMAGASESHNLIAGNVTGSLWAQLQKRACKVYPSDMRVKVPSTGSYTYADVTVVCGESEFEDGHLDILLNPTVLIEILSPSTEGYGRGKKLEHYRRLESLREYLLISQDHKHIEQYVRQVDGGWHFSDSDAQDNPICLESIGCSLTIDEVYLKVTLPDQPQRI